MSKDLEILQKARGRLVRQRLNLITTLSEHEADMAACERLTALQSAIHAIDAALAEERDAVNAEAQDAPLTPEDKEALALPGYTD
jgi:hypothetical protein